MLAAKNPKAFINRFPGWNGISIRLTGGLCCVDLDSQDALRELQDFYLPPTLKERSRRGLHLFYSLPASVPGAHSKIKWRKSVDLLCEEQTREWNTATLYAGTRTVSRKSTLPKSDAVYCGRPFQGHVLCSPTPGYSRVWPETRMSREQVPQAFLCRCLLAERHLELPA